MTHKYDFEAFLLENIESVNLDALKEYCNGELKPNDAFDKYKEQLADVVESVHESICERIGIEIDRFDYGCLLDYGVDTSFVDEAVLISFVRRQVYDRFRSRDFSNAVN